MSFPIKTRCWKNVCCAHCGVGWGDVDQKCNNIICYDPPTFCEPTKGLVQSLKDKIISLQNESKQFKLAKRPIKKKQKDYYCLMLRKINRLDRKLQNLEDLFLSNLDHTQDELFGLRDHDKDCEYSGFYDSVLSLTNLANKLKEDILYNKNGVLCNNQNMTHLYDKIQIIETGLCDLFTHLNRLHNNEAEGNKNFVQEHLEYPPQYAQATKYQVIDHEKAASSGTRIILQPKQDSDNKHELLKPKNKEVVYEDLQGKPPYYVKARHNSPFRCQCNRCNPQNTFVPENFDVRYPSSKNNRGINQQVCSCSECEENRQRREAESKHRFSNTELVYNRPTACCSCAECSNNNGKLGIHSRRLYYRPRGRFFNRRHINNETFYHSNLERRHTDDRQHNIPSKTIYSVTSTTPYLHEEEDFYFRSPTRNSRPFRKKQNNGKRNTFNRANMDIYYHKELERSPQKVEVKNVTKEKSTHLLNTNESDEKVYIRLSRTDETKPLKKQETKSNFVYFEVSPKIEHDTYHQDENKDNREKRTKLNVYKGNQFRSRESDHLKESQSKSSEEDLRPHAGKNSKRAKRRNIKNNDLNISERDETENINRYEDDLLFPTNKAISNFQTTEHFQKEANHTPKKHIHLKFYEKEKLNENYMVDHHQEEEGDEPPLRNRFESHKNRNWKYSHRQREDNFSRHELNNNFEKGKPQVHEYESFETGEETKIVSGSSPSSSSNFEMHFCSNPNCTSENDSEEMIIFLNKNNSSPTNLKNIYTILKDFETDSCSDCVVIEKTIKIPSSKAKKSKKKTKCEVITRREVIKCANCRAKLDKKLCEVINKNSKLDKSALGHASAIDKEKRTEKKPNDKSSFEDGHNNFFYSQDNNALPIFQAKIKEENLFKQENVNLGEPDKSLELPKIGNTININIDKASFSVDTFPDNISSLITKENQFSKENTQLNVLKNGVKELETNYKNNSSLLSANKNITEENYINRLSKVSSNNKKQENSSFLAVETNGDEASKLENKNPSPNLTPKESINKSNRMNVNLDKNVEKFETLQNKTGMPVFFNTALPPENIDIEGPQKEKRRIKDHKYTNRVIKNTTPIKTSSTYPGLNRCFKEYLAKKSVARPINRINPKKSTKWQYSNDTLRQCSVCPSDVFVTRRPGTFYPGRRISKQLFKHRYNVYPRTSSKNVKLSNSFIRNPNGKYTTHLLNNNFKETSSETSKNGKQNDPYNVLGLSLTSESSFSVLDWEKVAKTLKEEKHYIL